MAILPFDPNVPFHGHAVVVTRHPATIRRVAQALGAVGIHTHHALSTDPGPGAPKDTALTVLDLDVDTKAEPLKLVEALRASCSAPMVVVAGVSAKRRLLGTLGAPGVLHAVPKLGGWLDTPMEQRTFDGPDEQDLAIALRRMLQRPSEAVGARPYLIEGFSISEVTIGSSSDKEMALAQVLGLADALELSEEKRRRIEVATEELLLNAIYDAPRVGGKPLYSGLDRRTPVTLDSDATVRLRYGCDGRNFVVAVADRFGALGREAVVRSLVKLIDPAGARPMPGTSGAGLGLMLAYGAANQLITHTAPGRFTEVTAVMHVSGSNRTALARGSALHLYLDGSN